MLALEVANLTDLGSVAVPPHAPESGCCRTRKRATLTPRFVGPTAVGCEVMSVRDPARATARALFVAVALAIAGGAGARAMRRATGQPRRGGPEAVRDRHRQRRLPRSRPDLTQRPRRRARWSRTSSPARATRSTRLRRPRQGSASRRMLRRVLFDVDKDSEVVFYYAGHGRADRRRQLPDPDRRQPRRRLRRAVRGGVADQRGQHPRGAGPHCRS